MKSKSNIEFVVGIFALAGFAIIVFLSTTINPQRAEKKRGEKYYALFETISGLTKQTPIELAGITVGYVEAIDLKGTKAKLTISIRPDVSLRSNASLRVKDLGILGDKILILNAGDPPAPVLAPGSTIGNTSGHSDFDRLVTTLADASKDIKSITATIKDFVGRENEEENLRATLRNFKTLSESLVKTTKSFERLMDGNEGKIANLIDDLDHISSNIREAVDDKDSGIKESLKKVNQAMNSLASVMKKIEDGKGTIGKLVNDESTVDNINKAIEGVNEFVGSARRIQTSFLYRGEWLFGSKELQNLVGLYIRTRPDKFFLIEMIDAPQGNTRVTNNVISSPPGTVIATTENVQTRDDLLFSLQFGKRFYDATLRFGIIRSDGGVGLDYHFLNDIVKVSVEGYNFNRYNDRFQMRLYGTIQLYKNLLVAAGVNDLITKRGSKDFFLGAGVFFTDNDFKSLLSAVSLPSF